MGTGAVALQFRIQPEEREHAAGFSFFGAIRIIAIEIASGTLPRVVDLSHPLRATLLDNVLREIDFVMRRANAGTELHEQAGRIRSESRLHLRDRVGNDAELGSFASGMNETDRGRLWIDNVNRAAIGYVNAKRDAAPIRDETVAAGEILVAVNVGIDNRDFIAVNLLRR